LVPFWRYISIKNVLERLCRSQLSKVAWNSLELLSESQRLSKKPRI
jgi:hypothetical protein